MKVDLGTFGGPNSSAAGYPSDKGVIAVSAQTPEKDPSGEFFLAYYCVNDPCQGVNPDNISLPFRWEDGVLTALPTLGGNQGQAYSANNLGQVVGFAENSTHDTSCVPPQVLDFEAAIWGPKGEIQELPPFPGDASGQAFAINDHGRVVGCSGTCGSTAFPAAAFLTSCVHATLWQNGEEGWSVTDLGSLGGAMNNLAGIINNRGQVAGASDLPGDATTHAFLWTEEKGMQDLGTLPGDVFSGASAMNNKGQIVGQSCDAMGNCRAFLWENGVMTDLNALISSGSSLSLIYGADINDNGEIVGAACALSNGVCTSNTGPAFLAVPCDEAHANYEGCANGAASVPATAQAVSKPTNVILPESIRQRLQKRGLAHFAGRPGIPH